MDCSKAIEHFRAELRSVHTNRPTPALVEELAVQAYGATMRLQELATISVPEPQTLQISPWDSTQIKAIEDAIRKDQKLQLQPVVDGNTIRIHFPQLTEEKRRDLVKIVHEKAEDVRIAVRKLREDALKQYKDMQKASDMSEDEYYAQEKDVQSAVDTANATIKTIADQKEQELLTM